MLQENSSKTLLVSGWAMPPPIKCFFFVRLSTTTRVTGGANVKMLGLVRTAERASRGANIRRPPQPNNRPRTGPTTAKVLRWRRRGRGRQASRVGAHPGRRRARRRRRRLPGRQIRPPDAEAEPTLPLPPLLLHQHRRSSSRAWRRLNLPTVHLPPLLGVLFSPPADPTPLGQGI